jgi:hypothetical protein
MGFEVLQLFWNRTPQNKKAHLECAFGFSADQIK